MKPIMNTILNDLRQKLTPMKHPGTRAGSTVIPLPVGSNAAHMQWNACNLCGAQYQDFSAHNKFHADMVELFDTMLESLDDAHTEIKNLRKMQSPTVRPKPASAKTATAIAAFECRDCRVYFREDTRFDRLAGKSPRYQLSRNTKGGNPVVTTYCEECFDSANTKNGAGRSGGGGNVNIVDFGPTTGQQVGTLNRDMLNKVAAKVDQGRMMNYTQNADIHNAALTFHHALQTDHKFFCALCRTTYVKRWWAREHMNLNGTKIGPESSEYQHVSARGIIMCEGCFQKMPKDDDVAELLVADERAGTYAPRPQPPLYRQDTDSNGNPLYDQPGYMPIIIDERTGTRWVPQ